MRITRILSGGQTGADRGGLDAAMDCGIPHGGWCPAGRKAEDGPIPARYRLRETQSDVYAERTAANVRAADATVVFTPTTPTGGSRQTIDFCLELERPCLHIALESTPPQAAAERVIRWLDTPCDPAAQRLPPAGSLNVAGSRESQAPGMHALVRAILQTVLRHQAAGSVEPGKSSYR